MNGSFSVRGIIPKTSRMDASKVFLVFVAFTVTCWPVCRRGGGTAIGNDVVFVLVVDKFFVVVRAHFCRIDSRKGRAEEEKRAAEEERREEETETRGGGPLACNLYASVCS